MSKRKTKRSSQQMGENLRLNPQLRLCPKFDPDSIAEFHVGEPGEMGVRVVDNCAEEHMRKRAPACGWGPIFIG